MANRREHPLKIEVVDGAVVISIGVNTLVRGAEASDQLRPFNLKTGQFDQWKILDADDFAQHVVHCLTDEQDDGRTPFIRALDAACFIALATGASYKLVASSSTATSLAPESMDGQPPSAV